MGRPEDPLWEHAKKLKNGRSSCNFCHRQFAGGISRIKWHLSGLEGHDIKVCEKVPRDIQLAVQEALDTLKKKDRHVNVTKKKRRKDRLVEDENCSVPSSSGGPNLYMEKSNVLMDQNDSNNLLELNREPNSGNEKDKYCKQLAKLFFSFGIHPETIFSPIFEDFVKRIVESGPSYQLSSTFTDDEKETIMFEVIKEAQEYVEKFINDPDPAGCTLMVNIWQHYDRVDIFAYSQRGAACLKSVKYEPRSESLQEVISSTIKLLDPNHVVQLLIPVRTFSTVPLRTFSTDINRDQGDFLKIKNQYPWICVSYCAADEINSFLCQMEWKLHSVIFSLVRFVYSYHHSIVSSRREMKRPKENSAFIHFILKSILKIEDELQVVPFSSIIETSDRVKLLDKQEKAKHFRCAKLLDHYIIGDKEFWRRVKAVKEVWFLLFQTRCLVNREDSSIGYLYQMIERLKDGIEKSCKEHHFVYDLVWEIFSDMRRKIFHPIHAVAALLDPAYMCTNNFKENAEMIDGTNYMLENMVDSDEKEAFTKELYQYCEELPKLFTAQPMITMLETRHPAKIWWESEFCRKHTPVLRKYAIRILSQPCSISFCRRYEVLLGDWTEDWTTKVNTIIRNGNSKSVPELEPIILNEFGKDHDAFKDVTELDEDWHNYFLSQFTTDSLVDCMINDPNFSLLDDFHKVFKDSTYGWS